MNEKIFMLAYGRQLIDEDDIQEVIHALRGNMLTNGPYVEQFEAKLCQVTDSPYTVACSNGTTALHLALIALDIGPGDSVLVPAVTFLASANAVRYVGADVVFVDIDPDTGLITPETLVAAIEQHPNHKFKAIINVHFAGQCGDLEGIYALAQKHGLRIIEDGAHAIGSSYFGADGSVHAVGKNRYSDITTFSFHPVKTIAMGEGGAITTQCPDLSQRMRTLRTHGMVRDPKQFQQVAHGPWYYEMQELGYNYRVSDINCALGLSQLRKLDAFIKARQHIVDYYDAAFTHMPHIQPMKQLSSSKTAWHLYVVSCDFNQIGRSQAECAKFLATKGISVHVQYMPLYYHPYYQKLYGDMRLPGAESYYKNSLCLPLYVGLSEQDLDLVIESVGQL
ncbi:MAG: UDP-4-amino-4,6-dideoxy-N-acetyl-beta-L-altrosamine transaminase [Alphaproteobacteria bacterium]|nr:UDP-4-amino-4,6-dideoxy-N-acetyl-beta-L-altrosamine transaminase [Alphaproteobacteria bacterium]